MEKERKLYDKFVEVLNKILQGEPSPAELKIIKEFLHDNNITALKDKHNGLNELSGKIVKLPFNDEEIEDEVWEQEK